jgi:hypothetical protein|tara:strand:+ start:2945 stop:3376 length:432 start_codon:yes stop_codon:yes gene_type:complete
MALSLEDIFQQAKQDDYCVELNGKGYQARLVYGIKIVKDNETEEVVIYNTAVNGSYYHIIPIETIKTFTENSWRYGVYNLSLSNYRTKLDMIEKRIKTEINGRKSEKQIAGLKSHRERILGKYTEVNQKLNQLNSNHNETSKN